MDKQPAFDRSVLIPILLGGFSIFGIVVVLLIGRSLNSPPEVPVTPSATRFQYVFLGTEPVITTPLLEDTEISPPEAPTEEIPTEPVAFTQVISTPTRPGPLTPIILPSATARTNTPAPPTATSASGPPLNPGTYDDVDSHLIYNGWNATNSGGTLHVSITPGSTISFRFIGRELRLLYQAGSTLGRIQITIDGVSETENQSTGNGEYVSDLLANGTHNVLIKHQDGGSVNLDQVIIPEPANTPTPTRTATQQN